jgi:hypothetical protein
MVGSFKQSLLVLSSISVVLAGCTYNEDELHAGNPGLRDASATDLPGAADLPGTADLPGGVDLLGAEDLPPVSAAPDADIPADAAIADVVGLPDGDNDTNAPEPDARNADANVDASVPERDASADLGRDRAAAERAERDTSVDTVDLPPTGPEARDAGVNDSTVDVQERESGALDGAGIAG